MSGYWNRYKSLGEAIKPIKPPATPKPPEPRINVTERAKDYAKKTKP